MQINATVVCDSVSETGNRITTLEIVFPKCLLAEFNTHRVFSRNFSSSRAIPVIRNSSIENTFEPLFFGKNQPGMQSMREEIEEIEEANKIWNDCVAYCKDAATRLSALGLHKQWANRPTDWFVMANGIVTSTEWDNFFELRDHEDAQPEIRELAIRMKEAITGSTPNLVLMDEWHLPYILDEEKNDPFYKIPANKMMLQKISAARCCRVSYLKHDGNKPNVDDDLALFQRLAGAVPKHYSPLEHIATPLQDDSQLSLQGNLNGWVQYRKLDEQEVWKQSASEIINSTKD